MVSRTPSVATRAALDALASEPRAWRHGYDLMRLTGLKSGTLYPLLIRLEGQGYLEARWQPPSAPGRPSRHMYRLTDDGLRFARTALMHDRHPAHGHIVGALA